MSELQPRPQCRGWRLMHWRLWSQDAWASVSKEVAAETAAAERLLSRLRLSLLPILKVERAPGAMEVSSRL